MTATGLKRVLGLSQVSFIAIGFTIGAGVFVFTGIAARIVGPALPLAYGLAVIPVFISMLPLAMLGSALPRTGGTYWYPSRMVSPGLAFVGVWVYVLASFFGQIPLYAIGCARYARLFFPHLSMEGMAISILTLFFVVNLLGVRPAAQVQGLMVILLISALLFYSMKGISMLDRSHLESFFQRGTGNLALGVALLTFTYLGSNGIIELGEEIRDPGRTIPRALFIAFPVVTVVYLLVSFATVGAVPWTAFMEKEEPLLTVGRACLGRTGIRFFVLGGAILALTTTLNALFIVGTKSLLMIVHDGMLPRSLGKVNRRFGTAHVLLTIIWGLSILGVLTGFSLETFATYAALGGMVIFFPVVFSSLYLPRRYPRSYEASPFKLTGFWLWFCPITGLLTSLFLAVLLLVDLHSFPKVLFFMLFVLSGVVVFQWRKRQLMKRGIDLGLVKAERPPITGGEGP